MAGFFNMPAGILPKDRNFVSAVGGTSSATDTAASIRPFQYNASTRGMTVHIVGTDVGASGGTSSTDDSAFVAGVGAGTPMMGFVTSDAVDAGDVGVVGMLENRQLKVTLFDSSGVELSVGGGTQYTEDAAAAANPVGNALILVREDGLAGSLTNTDGDNVAARGNNKGELYVKHTDAIAVTNAGLTELAAAIDTEVQVDIVGAIPAGNNNIGDVDVASSALPTGASTSAKQDTEIAALQLIDNIVYVDDADWTDDTSSHALVGGVYQSAPHTVTDGDVTPFLTDVNGRIVISDGAGSVTVDNAGLTELAAAINASSQMDVNIAANGIGLATSAKQDTIIGHVDGIETALTAANSSLDAIEASVAAIDVDTTTIIGHVDGIEGLLTTIDADTGSILTAVQLIDDAAVVLGTATYTEATSTGLAIGAIRRDADTSPVNNTNEWGPLQMDANGRLKVEIFTGGETFAVLDTNSAAALTALQLIDDAIFVDDTATHATGTTKGVGIMGVAVPTDTAISANDIGMVGMSLDRRMYTENVGNIAHDGIDSGNPIKIGFKAVDLGATPTAVASLDRTDALSMRNGIQFVLGGHPNTLSQSLQITDADGAQTDTAIITVSAGTAIVVTKVSVTADNANTVDVSCRIGFGTANTPAVDAAGIILFHPGIAAGSGVIEGNGAGIIGIGASNEDLRVTCEDPVTGSINIIVTYFTVLIG